MNTPSTGTDVHKGINRNILILGAVGILTIGAIVLYIALKPSVETTRIEQDIRTKFIENQFFQSLVESGRASSDALSEIERAIPSEGGYIGISKKRMSFADGEALANRCGSEVLSPAALEDVEWLAEKFPELNGRSVWIRTSEGSAALIDAPDVLLSSDAGKTRPVFLRWAATGSSPENVSSDYESSWSWTIEPAFDEATEFREEIAGARKGKKWGIIDRKGNWVARPIFRELSERQLEELNEIGFLRTTHAETGLNGIIDRTGKTIIPFEYDQILSPSPFGYMKISKVAEGKTLWGWIGQELNVLVGPEWEDVQEPIHGRIPVKRAGKWGYLDLKGNLVIPCSWDDAWRFTQSGFAIVTRGNKRGYIDRSGKVVVSPKWDGATNFAPEGFAMVREGNVWGLIDRKGRVVVEPEYHLTGYGASRVDWANRMLDWNIFRGAKADGTSVVYNLEGKPLPELALPRGSSIHVVSGESIDLLLVDKGTEGQSLRDRQGNEVFRTSGRERINASQQPMLDEGLVWVGMSNQVGKGGFINGKGEWNIRFSDGDFDEMKNFSEGFAAVRKNGKWGYVDTKGKIVVAPVWNQAGEFHNGVALVSLAGVTRSDSRSNTRFSVISPSKVVFEIEAPAYHLNRGFENASRGIYGKVDGVSGWWSPQGKKITSSSDDGGRVSPADWKTVRGLVSRYWTRFHSFPGFMGSRDLVSADGTVVMRDIGNRSDFTDTHIPYALPPKYGLMSTKGEVLHEPEWDEIKVINEDWVWIRKDGKAGLASTKGKVVIPPEWAMLSVLRVNTASLDANGEVMRYRFGTRIYTDWVLVSGDDGVSVLRTDGSRALKKDDRTLEFVDFFGPEKLVYLRRGPAGKESYFIYEPAADRFVAFPEADKLFWTWQSAALELLIVGTGAPGEETWHLYDSQGTDLNVIVTGTDDSWHINKKTLLLKTAEGWRVFDAKGNPLGDGPFPEVRRFSEERAAVRIGDKWSFIDTQGKLIHESGWAEVRDLVNGRAAVKDGALWGYINPDGESVIVPVWDSALDFSSFKPHGKIPESPHFAPVSAFGRSAIIATDGGLLCDPKYISLRISENERLIRATEPRVSVIRFGPNGEPIFDEGVSNPRRRAVSVSFERSWVYSSEDNAWALCKVDESGDKNLTPYIWGEPFFQVSRDEFSGDLIHARTADERYGLLRDDGTEVVAPQWARIGWVAPGVAAAWSSTGGGLLDAEGKWLFKDNSRIRIARFGLETDRAVEGQHRHGVIVIEDTPKWGYAKLNSIAPR